MPRMFKVLCLTLAFTPCGSNCPSLSGAEKPARIIDTHIHLYDTRREGGVPWPPKSAKQLYAPHLPDDFKGVAQPAGATGAVVVEASPLVEDNRWLLDLVEGDGFFVGVVGNLDPASEDFARHLQRFAKDPRFVGIRPRAHKDTKFNSDAVLSNLRLLARRGLTLDVLMHGVTIRDVDELAAEIPELTIVVNHVLGRGIDGRPPDAKWREQVQSLARHKNVYCKISGLYQQSRTKPPPKDVRFYRPVLDVLWEAFGRERLIYGSNWPVSKRGGDYASYVRIVTAYFEPKGKAALNRYFWKNAVEAYRLKVEMK